jgi:diguanylate cyclase (GGDEF)-like protein
VVEYDDSTKRTDEPSVQATDRRDRAYLIVLTGSRAGEMHRIEQPETTIGREEKADIRITDDGVSRRHASLRLEKEAVRIEDMGSTNGTFLNEERITGPELLKDGDKLRIGSTTILKFSYQDSLEEKFQLQLYEAALRDAHTKVFNKRYFVERLKAEFAYSIRNKTALTLVMFDLDRFKAINDTFGHVAGDAVLVEVARLASESIRSEDLLARYGGEEFTVLCRGIAISDGQKFAERLRQLVEALQFSFQGKPIPVTISLGIASLPDPDISDAMTLISAADDALYQAKRAGRNRAIARTPGKVETQSK